MHRLLPLLLLSACAHIAPPIEDAEASVRLLADNGHHEAAIARAREILENKAGLQSDSEARLRFQIVDALLALGRTKDAAAEARTALSLSPETSRDADLYEGLVRLDDGHETEAFAYFLKSAHQKRLSISAFAHGRWLDPVRKDSRYPSLVAAMVLAHEGLTDWQLKELNEAGDLSLSFTPNAQCVVALVRFKDAAGNAELVAPAMASHGTEVHTENNATYLVKTGDASVPGVFWGEPLIVALGYEKVTSAAPPKDPVPAYQLELSPTGTTARFVSDKPDPKLAPGRIVAMFACGERVIAYAPFDSAGL